MVNLLICGDYYPCHRISELIAADKGDVVFQDIQKYIRGTDFSIVNLEYPVVLNDEKPIKKCGPNLKGNEASVQLLEDIGFNVVTLANNHILDYGADAMFNTENICHKHKLSTVGIGGNIEDSSHPLILEKDNNKIAIINCCEHEFSVASENEAGACPLDPVKQFYTIRNIRKTVDYVMVIVHGGTEHYQLPSPRMKETYRFFIDVGADVVINHHQHCYSGYELHNGKPIFYGLGNFCFDSLNKRNGIWNEGYMVQLTFADNLAFELIPYVQCDMKPIVSLMKGTKKEQFNEIIVKWNAIIADDKCLLKKYKKFCESRYEDFQLVCSPYSSRIGKALAHRHFLPRFLSTKRIVGLLNYISCESHREKMIDMLHNSL